MHSQWRVIRAEGYTHICCLQKRGFFRWKTVARGYKEDMIKLGKRKGKQEVLWEE